MLLHDLRHRFLALFVDILVVRVGRIADSVGIVPQPISIRHLYTLNASESHSGRMRDDSPVTRSKYAFCNLLVISPGRRAPTGAPSIALIGVISHPVPQIRVRRAHALDPRRVSFRLRLLPVLCRPPQCVVEDAEFGNLDADPLLGG